MWFLTGDKENLQITVGPRIRSGYWRKKRVLGLIINFENKVSVSN